MEGLIEINNVSNSVKINKEGASRTSSRKNKWTGLARLVSQLYHIFSVLDNWVKMTLKGHK